MPWGVRASLIDGEGDGPGLGSPTLCHSPDRWEWTPARISLEWSQAQAALGLKERPLPLPSTTFSLSVLSWTVTGKGPPGTRPVIRGDSQEGRRWMGGGARFLGSGPLTGQARRLPLPIPAPNSQVGTSGPTGGTRRGPVPSPSQPVLDPQARKWERIWGAPRPRGGTLRLLP